MDKKVRYSDAELEEFRVIINDKIKKAEEDLQFLKETYQNGLDNGTDDTAPQFRSFEDGADLMAKEANMQLAMRQEKFIRDLKNAIVRIENKTYGICRKTGVLIQKERLRLVPHATLSVEAKRMQ